MDIRILNLFKVGTREAEAETHSENDKNQDEQNIVIIRAGRVKVFSKMGW